MHRFVMRLLVFLIACTLACTGTLSDKERDETDPDTANTNNLNNENPGTNNDSNQNGETNNAVVNNDSATNNSTNNGGNNNTNNQTVDPCADVTCGANAVCSEGGCECESGFTGDPVSGCTPADPCAGVMCPYGASCNQGMCSCDAGFMDDGNGGCVAISPGDTATRTQAEVCDRWNADFPTQSQSMWQVAPGDSCDPGVLHADVLTDALRRLSLYRWLVGLPAVTTASGQLVNTQSCATTLAAENAGLTHNIPMDYACYSSEAAAGASSSNIAMGRSHPADSVDLYIADRNVRSLGHRRWCFNPSMGATAFGQRDSYSCMYAFDRSGSASPDYVAYPAPGFFPQRALSGYWSFGSNQYGLSNASVTMTRVSDGSDVPVQDVYTPGGGYGLTMVAWQVPNYDTGVEYEITISDLGGNNGSSVTYRTTVVDCN